MQTLGQCVCAFKAALLACTPTSPLDNTLVTSSEMLHTPGTGIVLSALLAADGTGESANVGHSRAWSLGPELLRDTPHLDEHVAVC